MVPVPTLRELHLLGVARILNMPMKRLVTPKTFLVGGLIADDALLVSGVG